MNIYVQSCGVEQDRDYSWLQIFAESTPKRQTPPLSEKVVTLIHNESPSVVLERLENEQLLLLIAGIEPEGKLDILDRQIRVSVAWVGESADESFLRRLAVSALQEETWKSLTEAIARAITYDDIIEEHPHQTSVRDNGFYASFEGLQNLELINESEKFSSEEPDLTKKIGRNSLEMRTMLADELYKCQLPFGEYPLVVVTGIKKRATLEDAGVWRSLSRLVEADNWEEIPPPESIADNGWAVIDLREIFALPLNSTIAILSRFVKIFSDLMSREPPSQSPEDEAINPDSEHREAQTKSESNAKE